MSRMAITAPAESDRALALGVLMPGFNGTTAPEWVLRATAGGLAAVMVIAANCPDVATTRALTDALHAAGPVLVAVDEEGGDVTRLQAVAGSDLPGAGALGAADDLDLTQRTGAALGSLLVAAGIDLNLAPVLDVASEPRNPVIGVRSFGPDAQRVARHGAAFLTGLHAGGAGGCGKHFPGHGATTTDSHLELPVLDVTEQVLAERDLPPFVAAARAGLDAVMTGHLHIPVLGDRPASVEPAVTALARNLPGGQERAIITDALDMGAVSGPADAGIGRACVAALQAGADLLCLGTTGGRDDAAMFEVALAAVLDGLQRGELDPALLARSGQRNRLLAQRIAGYRAGAPALDPAGAQAAVAEIGALAARAAVRVAAGDARLAETDRTVRAMAPVLVDLRRRYNQATGRVAPGFAHALAARFSDAQVLRAGVQGAAPWGDVLARLAPNIPILALTREPLADPREQADLDLLLARRPGAVVIHSGTADGAPHADRLVLAHGVGRANAEAAFRLIFGN